MVVNGYHGINTDISKMNGILYLFKGMAMIKHLLFILVILKKNPNMWIH